MRDDFIQDRAALYVSGDMLPVQREGFEVLIEARADVRAHLAGLQEAAAAVMLAPGVVAAPAGLRARILDAVAALPPPDPEALVLADAEGRIEWVNAEFTALCGYTLAELRGRKPGHVLQGPGTDPAAVARLRAAVRAGQTCRETLLNYHKNGTPYRVDIHLIPLLEDDGRPAFFAAREKKTAGA